MRAASLLRAISPARSPPAVSELSRRRLASLALLPLLSSLQPARRAAAFDLPFSGASGANVDILSTPEVCQGKVRKQDFAVVRYTGRFQNGAVFDDRYATRPLIYEVGTFYLPGVDDWIEDACVGTKVKISWDKSPSLGPAFEAALPTGSQIELELELVTIRYQLFGEKMKNSSNTFFFAEAPLTLSSAPDFERGHASGRVPTIDKDNWFSIAPGEKYGMRTRTREASPHPATRAHGPFGLTRGPLLSHHAQVDHLESHRCARRAVRGIR